MLFCWAFFLLVFTGSGWLAIDSVLARRHKADKVDAPPVERADRGRPPSKSGYARSVFASSVPARRGAGRIGPDRRRTTAGGR